MIAGAMKVVITGATGFIGGAVARRLAAEGAEVHVLVQPTSNRERLAGCPVTFHVGDITGEAGLDGLFYRAEWVIHAAGMLGRAGVSQETYNKVNAEGARHVFSAVARAVEAGETSVDLRVLHVSSGGVLGPVRKDAPGAVFDETSPLAPSTPYEHSKALAETYAQAFVDQGLPLVIARPEFIYGPGDLHVLGLFRAIQRGVYFNIGDGNNTCHPTYVDDTVEGVLACLRGGNAGEIYNIAGPRPLPFRELTSTIAEALGVGRPRLSVPRSLAYAGATGMEGIGKLLGREMPLSRTGVDFFSQSRRSSYAKAERELGFTPHVDLHEGIARTVAWYREQGLF